jgi:hypothetical protein
MVDICAGVGLRCGSRGLGYYCAIGIVAGNEGYRSILVVLLTWNSRLVVHLYGWKELWSVPCLENSVQCLNLILFHARL